jgi:flagellar biosynthetic protein FliP
MNKKKKLYCTASLVFAVAVLLMTTILMIVRPVTASAESIDPDSIASQVPEDMDPDSITDLNTQSTETADHNDNTDGLSILYNNDSGSVSTPVRMLLVLTILSLAPSILIMLTSYTRIIIVLHFIRTAIGTQTAPPNQVLIGLALFLTFFIMWPTFQEINTTAIQPLDKGEITTEEFVEAAEVPIRDFIVNDAKVQLRDINLFMDISGQTYEDEEGLSDVPFTVLVPAFIISELRKAFIMGFLIYVPFIVIDMVVASVLMSMGMMMLPPTTISLPFKILLFILADGWNLVIGSLVNTFY